MKRFFRNDKGEFITRKEWFESNYGCISMPEVTKELNMIEGRLEKFIEYSTVRLSKIELAIFAAVDVRQCQSSIRSVYINKGGYVDVEAGYSANQPNREKVFLEIMEEFQKRLKEQRQYLELANSTSVEIPD
jgi:hypothetical protein